ncbi:MAG: MurR/RpiR family transcriptional regulator [Hyphomicrobiales bacterium]|nr:MurR/RpiR family transcriptional regulator [Hyphomicrobiales bacterium]
MSTRLILRVQERIARLTSSEQKLAAVILETPTLIETHTATELAKLAKVSKATAARFFKALGYADFEEVKLQAREERDRTQPYSYSATASRKMILGRTIGEQLNLELNNLTRTFEEMESDTLQNASRLIEEAPRVWFLGLGANSWFARYGQELFSRLRHNVQVLGLNNGTLAEELAMVGARDVMITMMVGPQQNGLRSVLSYAKTTRVKVITLSDHANFARAKRYSELVFHCHVANYGFIATHTTFVGTLRVLAIYYTGLAGEKAIQRIGLIDDINEELDMIDR